MIDSRGPIRENLPLVGACRRTCREALQRLSCRLAADANRLAVVSSPAPDRAHRAAVRRTERMLDRPESDRRSVEGPKMNPARTVCQRELFAMH